MSDLRFAMTGRQALSQCLRRRDERACASACLCVRFFRRPQCRAEAVYAVMRALDVDVASLTV